MGESGAWPSLAAHICGRCAWPARRDRHPKAISCSTGTSKDLADSMGGDCGGGKHTGKFRLRKASIRISQFAR